MPKQIDYPRVSFQRVIEMARAIDYLGGTCSVATCAEKMGVKITGAFTALIGAAKKHGLVTSVQKALQTTSLFRSFKLAFSEEEKRQHLRIAFLAPPLYKKLYERFLGKELPVEILDKLMIREFGVDEDLAPRVMNYFLEGIKTYGIMVNNKIVDIKVNLTSYLQITENELPDDAAKTAVSTLKEVKKNEDSRPYMNDAPGQATRNATFPETYTVHIYGPGIDSRLSVSEPDDFWILDAILAKLKKKYKV